jgi:hypothetical protein
MHRIPVQGKRLVHQSIKLRDLIFKSPVIVFNYSIKCIRINHVSCPQNLTEDIRFRRLDCSVRRRMMTFPFSSVPRHYTSTISRRSFRMFLVFRSCYVLNVIRFVSGKDRKHRVFTPPIILK